MKISELIAYLETEKKLRGDIPVTVSLGRSDLFEVNEVRFQDVRTFTRIDPVPRESMSEFSVNLSP